MEDHRHCESWGHARLLRLLPDWLRAGVHCRRMAPDLRPVGDHPAFVGPRCSSGRILLGLDGRSHWPAQSLYRDVAECLACHRHYGIHTRPGRLDFSLVLPILRRLRQRRLDCRGHSVGAGICPVLQAWLGQRNDHCATAGWQLDGRALRRIFGATHRLAGTLSRRSSASSPGSDDPLLGPGISALVDPDGTARRGETFACVGAKGRSQPDRTADGDPRGRENTVARTVQVSAQHRGSLLHRIEPDGRGGNSCYGSRLYSCWC